MMSRKMTVGVAGLLAGTVLLAASAWAQAGGETPERAPTAAADTNEPERATDPQAEGDQRLFGGETAGMAGLGADVGVPGAGEMAKLLARSFFGLLVIVLLVVGLFAAYKRITGQSGTTLFQRNIQIIETAHLGTKRSLHLVRVGSAKLLVASSAEGVALLSDVTDAVADDEQLCEEPERKGFAEALKKMLASSLGGGGKNA